MNRNTIYRLFFILVIIGLLIGCGKETLIQQAKLIQNPVPFYKRVAGSTAIFYDGIKTERFTLIRNEQETWLLYDKLVDNDELINFAGLDEYTFIQLDLEKQLRQLLKNSNCKYVAKYRLIESLRVDTGTQYNYEQIKL